MNSSALTDTYNLTVTDNPSLTVTLNPGTPISLNPTAEGVFGSQDVGVNVMTTDDKGYTLTMSAATSSLSRSTADSSAPVIETLASATAQNDFPNNRWGFKRTSTKYTDTNFQPMLANYNVPISSNGNITGSSGETSTLTFGVKLNTDIPSGEYSIAINFLAVNNVAPNLYYMQDATPSSLAAPMPNVHDTAVLYDRRDGQEYTIAKLKDGKYWMTKNLNLAGGTVLTSEDTDMPEGYILPVATGFQEGNKLPESSTTGFLYDSHAYVFNSNSTDCTKAPGCYSYYSWNAATLGSGANVSNDNSDAPYSVCPKGWKLPTSRSTLELAKTSSDFYQLATAYGMDASLLSQNTQDFYNNASNGATPNFNTAGLYFQSEYQDPNAGHYWSSTSANSIYLAQHLYFYASQVNTNNVASRLSGFPVRCLFDDTMQSFSSDYANAMAMEETITLRDARDNQEYTVARLKDGKVWMTKNLNLAGGTTITPADSDVAKNYTLPTSSTTGFDNDTYAPGYVYNTGNNTDSCDSGCYSYYSYNAATASSGVDIATDNTDAPYSICPAGWRLPTSRTTMELATGTPGSDFYNMAINYGLDPTKVNEDPDNEPKFCNLGGDCSTNTVPRFLRAGSYVNSRFYGGGADGHYWSSTANSSTGAPGLHFYSSHVYSASSLSRRAGFSVRCLLRTE